MFWSISSFHGRIFYLRAPRSARAPKIFSISYSLINSIHPRYFQNSYICWIHRCGWLWMLSFFMKNPKKIQIFEDFEKFENFWKKVEFQKKIQTSNCSKKFAFWVMTAQKKLQRNFIIKITFLKKFLARVHFRARRAPTFISLWKVKNHRFLA